MPLIPNSNTPFGFVPYDAEARLEYYPKSASSPAIFRGDAVAIDANGQLIAATSVAEKRIVGVAAESVASGSAAAAVAVYGNVTKALYVVQEDSVGVAMSQSLIGNIADITGFTPGSSALVAAGHSVMQLDTSTADIASVAGLLRGQMKIIMMHPIENGSYPDTTGNPRKVVIKFSPYFTLGGTTSGI